MVDQMQWLIGCNGMVEELQHSVRQTIRSKSATRTYPSLEACHASYERMLLLWFSNYDGAKKQGPLSIWLTRPAGPTGRPADRPTDRSTDRPTDRLINRSGSNALNFSDSFSDAMVEELSCPLSSRTGTIHPSESGRSSVRLASCGVRVGNVLVLLSLGYNPHLRSPSCFVETLSHIDSECLRRFCAWRLHPTFRPEP